MGNNRLLREITSSSPRYKIQLCIWVVGSRARKSWADFKGQDELTRPFGKLSSIRRRMDRWPSSARS
jgi:hypothetical protein